MYGNFLYVIKLFLDKSSLFSHLIIDPSFSSSCYHVPLFQILQKNNMKEYSIQEKKKFWMKKNVTSRNACKSQLHMQIYEEHNYIQQIYHGNLKNKKITEHYSICPLCTKLYFLCPFCTKLNFSCPFCTKPLFFHDEIEFFSCSLHKIKK